MHPIKKAENNAKHLQKQKTKKTKNKTKNKADSLSPGHVKPKDKGLVAIARNGRESHERWSKFQCLCFDQVDQMISLGEEMQQHPNIYLDITNELNKHSWENHLIT